MPFKDVAREAQARAKRERESAKPQAQGAASSKAMYKLWLGWWARR